MRLVRLRYFAIGGALVTFALTWAIPSSYAQGVPGSDPNKCLAGKNKCVSKKIKGLLRCRQRCQKNPAKCGAIQTTCETKVRNKFADATNPDKDFSPAVLSPRRRAGHASVGCVAVLPGRMACGLLYFGWTEV